MARDYRQVMEEAVGLERPAPQQEGCKGAQKTEQLSPREQSPSTLVEQLHTLVLEEQEKEAQLGEALSELKVILDELRQIGEATHGDEDVLSSYERSMAQVAEAADRKIRETAQESMRLIKGLEQESRTRIERLALVTIPDRAFAVGKWAVLLLAMFLLAHAAWGILVQ